MLRCFLLVTLLMLLPLGEASASLNCGTVVIIERDGPFTVIRNFGRPCSGHVLVAPPGTRVIVPDRRFGFDGHLHRDIERRRLFAVPLQRHVERGLTVPPLALRPISPAPRHRFMRREWR